MTPAYLDCPVCGSEGLANTGHMDADGNEQNRPSPLTTPSWCEDDEGPCVSCGVMLRVMVADEDAYLVEVEP